MKRAFALVTALLMLAGCGVRPSEVIPAGEAPRQQATTQVTLFWLGGGRLVGHPRLTATPPAPDAAVAALLRGPTSAEQNFDLGTALPIVDVMVVSSYLDNQMIMVIDLAVAGWSDIALDQVACTAAFADGQDITLVVTGTDETREPHDCPLL